MKLLQPSNLFLITFITLFICLSCKTEKKTANDNYNLNQPLIRLAPYDEGYPLTNEEVDKNAPYKTEEFKNYYSDFYKDKSAPPPFNYNIDLSKLNFNELRLLRSEILARHGYLFMDYVVRSHFNATNWYQPVFWYNDFKIKLSEEEKVFIDKVLKLELQLYKNNYITSTDGYTKANSKNVDIWNQFDSIPQEMMAHLKQDGFVINKADYEQLFHVYDENYYDYTPSFITTDLYLQVLHMHISKEMQSLEEDKLVSLISQLLTEQLEFTKNITASTKIPTIKAASSWNQVYYAVALSLITDNDFEVPIEYQESYLYELEHAQESQGFKSFFLGDSFMDYSQFQPRGNYTKTDSLKNYFKCIKWLNSASIYIDNDAGLSRAIIMAYSLMKADSSLKKYETFSNIIKFLAGEENNISFVHLIDIINELNINSLEELLSKENLAKIRHELYANDPKKMFAQGANVDTEEFLRRKKILFTAGRYTFDGEILQRLANIQRENLKQIPKRPFPKALDVFAAMGNKTAEDILLNVYKEAQVWENYPDTLHVLKRKFEGFNNWNTSIYNKEMETILSLQKQNSFSPYFMKTYNWQKKNLNSMLASWTELKHDMVLYIDQPSPAEMGDGSDIPPPQKMAYVEPQLEFWMKCTELLNLNKKMLEENGLMTEKLSYRNNKLKEISELFFRISDKELKKQNISNLEFDSLSYIGGEVERLTMNIIEADKNSITDVSTPERYLAVATDVYTYNDQCLEEGVGMGEEIYVIAEINGLLYLTRGAVFSHYEFIQPTANRLTDEEWQKQLLEHNTPLPSIWMNDIKIIIPRLKTAPYFNLY